MSEERRKRQQERQGAAEGGSNAGKYLKWLGVVALLVGAWCAGWYYRNHKYDSFAKCLAAHQARMYGLYWCPHCIEQKEKFGASFKYISYVECAKLFPAWQFGTDPPKEGVLSLQALSDKTGCSLP